MRAVVLVSMGSWEVERCPNRATRNFLPTGAAFVVFLLSLFQLSFASHSAQQPAHGSCTNATIEQPHSQTAYNHSRVLIVQQLPSTRTTFNTC